MILEYFIEPGLRFLPERMDTPEARVMLVAIGLQESRFEGRFQVGGPARGFWQFERDGGIAGVLSHRSTRHIIAYVCSELQVPCTIEACYAAVAYNDVLACAFARLLLWPIPSMLPQIGEMLQAREYYVRAWRPGKERPEAWQECYEQAVEIIKEG